MYGKVMFARSNSHGHAETYAVLSAALRISAVRIVFFHFESNRILDYYSKFRIESNSFFRSQK